MTADKPTLEAHARELLDMPPEWRAYRWEVNGRGVYVEGAIPLTVYQRGPRRGQVKWKPRTHEAAIVVLNGQHCAWLTEWEAATGKCHNCSGTTQEWAGWSAKDGSRYRPCRRCEATGKAQQDKPIA